MGRIAPIHALAVAVAIGLAMIVFVMAYAHGQPWLGLKMSFDPAGGGAAVVHAARGPGAAVPVGARLTSIADAHDKVRFVGSDFVYEPDGSFGPFSEYETFLARQERMARISESPSVTVADDRGRTWTIQPAKSCPFDDMPPDFWVQLVVGVVAWLISAAIWSFRPGETSVRYLLLSGFATLMFAPLAAAYCDRELALHTWPLRITNDLNFLGGSLFAAALFSLLLYYPKKLAPRWLGVAVVGIFIAWFVAQEVGWLPNMTVARRLLVLIAVLGTFVLSAIHWWGTRRDPVARAALQWFLLSWVVCASIFGLGVLTPQMFGVDTSGLQGYGFTLFLLIYVGLTFGVLRFRLFELGEWWFRVLLWAGGVLLLVAFDLVFALSLRLSAGLSLGLALLLCGLVWLPLRGWVWSRIFMRQTVSERALFETVAETALSHDEDQARRWTVMLQELFEPLHTRPAAGVGRASLEQDGLALVVPGAGAAPPLRLEYAHGGRRLFNRRDVNRADELVGMLRHVLQSRRAYETGVAVERKRIARDMHDNIGAQLLHALHSPGGERKDRLIRDTLADLGAIINDDPGEHISLDEALADLRHETAERLAAAGLDLDWALENGDATRLEPTLIHTLRSVIRESVSNVVKHARARHVLVAAAMTDSLVLITVEDDGIGFDPESVERGDGLNNLAARVAARGGEAAWSRRDGGGTRFHARVPVTQTLPG